MPDTPDGGKPPKGPGAHVGTSAGLVAQDAKTGAGKSKRRRRRRGRKRSTDALLAKDAPAAAQSAAGGVCINLNGETPPANAVENPQPAGNQNGTAQNAAPENDNGKRAGKRSRRRNRRRNRRGSSDGNVGATNLNGNASAENGETDGTPLSSAQVNTNTGGNGADLSQARYRRNLPPKKHSKTNDRKSDQVSSKPNPVINGHGANPSPKSNGHRNNAYAALDLGTNNCRLLVAVPQQPGRFRVVDAFSRIVRLGEGLESSGRLSQAAMDRAVGALKACADKLELKTVRGMRLIATEACRRADNGTDFLERVRKESGLDLEIIDRETEARLAVAGCASLIDREAKGVVLFDIGGGSSELALLDLRKRRGYDVSRTIASWTSLPLGVVTLSEKHGGGEKVTRQVFDDMVAEVSSMLESFEGRDALIEVAKEGDIHLLGTSGTVTTLAGLHLKLPRYDRRQVDGIWMASKDVTARIEELLEMTFQQRVANPCIGKDRADLVLAGCAILVAIQNFWPCERLRVADRGLREGLLTEMMNRDNAWQRRYKPFRKPVQ